MIPQVIRRPALIKLWCPIMMIHARNLRVWNMAWRIRLSNFLIAQLIGLEFGSIIVEAV